ncbi:MAG: DUF1972 domain-containing protein [Saprospiraceae bacterium]
MSSKKLKLAIIGTVGLPAKYGGFETLVEQLVPHIEDEFEVTVYCSSKFYKSEDRLEYYGKTKLKYIPFKANGLQSIPYDIISIIHAAFTSNLLLILGVSGCLILTFVKFFTRQKAFVNIDGIEWKRNKWNFFVKTFLRYSEIFAVETAESIITDNQVICDYMSAAYNYNSNLIEYGGDQAKKEIISKESIKTYSFLAGRYAFSVCRIEPENHIHVLLEAMTKQSKLPLVIIGNWNNSEYGQLLKAQYKGLPNIHLLDPIYEPKLLNTIRSNCYLYLHGHSAGGTNPSLVEAMNLHLPIFAYDVMYNKETTENKAMYFRTTEELLQLVEEITNDKRESLADSMLAIAKRRYTWKVIAGKYRDMFWKGIGQKAPNKKALQSL